MILCLFASPAAQAAFETGDVSGDGEISAYDAALTAQKVVGLIVLTEEQAAAADVNYDGGISAYDAALIAQYSVGLDSEFFSFCGMRIESVDGNTDLMTITTTAATYKLSRTGMEMYRRIDPATNSINLREVALLEFGDDIGPLVLDSKTRRAAIIKSDMATFEFKSDSLFIITAQTGFTYKHKNLIQNPPWARGSDLDRIWTDGYGGSLHAFWFGTPRVISNGTDFTQIQMYSPDAMAGMVFPAKKFNFEKLYGQNARPFVHFIYDADGLAEAKKNMQSYMDNGFGVFMLWNSFYDQDIHKGHVPIKLDSGVLGYRINPLYEDVVRDFIYNAHARGFKIIFYLYGPAAREWRTSYANLYQSSRTDVYQDVDTTLNFMDHFRQDYGFDGWYFDNADVGDLREDYYFINSVRQQIGEAGIIFHHDSLDVWDNNRGWDLGNGIKYSGKKAVMIDCYADYALTGETGAVLAKTDGPDNPYLRYFCSGYGMSQALASEIILTNGKAAISEKEKYRVLAENLNGAERNMLEKWTGYFKPYYDKRKAQYLFGDFNPDANWPVQWFKTLDNIGVTFNSGNCVNIIWQTPEDSTGEVTYTSDGIWWHNQYVSKGADGMVHQARELSKHHSVTLPNLKANTNYQFRVRSNNLANDELVWGYVGSFTTSDGAEKPKCPAQVPQGCDSDCQSKLLAYWKFNSGDCDYSGNHNLFYYGAGFNGSDSFEFNDDYSDYIEIQKGNNSLADISLYGGEDNGKSTIMAWVKVRDANKYNVLSQHIGGIDYFSIGTDNSGKPVLRVMVYDKTNDKNYWLDSATAIQSNQWTHVAFVFQAGVGCRFYINGVLDQTSQVNGSNLKMHNYSETTGLAYLGYGNGINSYFDGNVKDFSVFNGALSDTQIYALYSGSR
jgi:hypothetical protein